MTADASSFHHVDHGGASDDAIEVLADTVADLQNPETTLGFVPPCTLQVLTESFVLAANVIHALGRLGQIPDEVLLTMIRSLHRE